MSLFQYQALRPTGEMEQGALEAIDQAAALELLRARGLVPVAVNLATRPADSVQAPIRIRPLSAGRRARLLRQLATLLQAGLPTDRGLAVLAETASGRAEKALALRLLQQVRNGMRLSDAAATEPAAFDAVALAMLRAGELSGQLGPLALHVAQGLERSHALRETLRSALIYPALVMMVALASIVVLLVGLLPRFAALFQAMGRPPPAATAMLLGFADAVPWILALLLLVWGGWRLGGQRWGDPVNRWQTVLLHMPIAGRLTRHLAAERLCRVLGVLLQGGVPMVEAVRVAAGAVGVARVEVDLRAAADHVRDGAPLSAALARYGGDLPTIVGEFVRVGEETGRLPAVLQQAASLLEDESRTQIHRLTATLAPVLTVVLGVVVGAVILTLLSALMDGYDLAL